MAPPDSDLTNEHELVTSLRTALGINDEHLVGLGYAEQLLGATILSKTATRAPELQSVDKGGSD